MSSQICKKCIYSANVSGMMYCKHFEQPEDGGAGFTRLSVGCTTPEQCVEMGLFKPKEELSVQLEKLSEPKAMTVRRGKSPADAWRCQKQITRKAKENKERAHGRKPMIDAALAMQMHREGESDIKIARACGVTTAAISRWRRRNGLPPNYEPWRKTVYDHDAAVEMMLTGASDVQVAAQFGVTKNTVKKLRRKRNIPGTMQIRKGVREASKSERSGGHTPETSSMHTRS